MTDYFPKIVGQEHIKKTLNFHIESYRYMRMIPNMIFIAQKGNGKTTIGKTIAENLIVLNTNNQPEIDPRTNKPKRKTFININCSSLTNLNDFVNNILVPHVQEKDSTVMFDECSEIPKDITMALLTILAPNPTHKTQFSYSNYTCNFDFRRQTFLFCTSEPNKVFHALLDRLDKLELEDLSKNQLGKILQQNTKKINYDQDVLIEICNTLRGNARSAQKLSEKILAFIREKTEFGKKEWDQYKEIFDVLPLGLSRLELGILKHLRASPNGTSLTALASKTGMSRTALQFESETFLLKHGLMEVRPAIGRQLTAKGAMYLKEAEV
mgnify:CR=1 FL=1